MGARSGVGDDKGDEPGLPELFRAELDSARSNISLLKIERSLGKD